MIRSLSLSVFSLALALPGAADPVLEKMRALSKEGPVYAYEMAYAEGDLLATGRIDPSQPEGQRIEVLSPDESEWTDDFRDGLKEMEADTDGDIWCTDFADMVPANARLSEESEGTATYVFAPQPEPDAESGEKKMMKKINGTITLAKSDGSVLAFNMVLPKPYKPAMIAKINVFEMDATCARAPDGRTFVEQFTFNISGSAMMQDFEESVSRTITRLLDPVG